MNHRTLFAGLVLAVALAIPSQAATTGINNVEYHTADEILTMYHLMGLDETVTASYAVEPDLSGLTTSGTLSAETQQNALDTLNFVRYIAGLSYDVTIRDTYAQYAQDGALVLAALGQGLSHTPTCPDGMDASIYKSGYTGTNHGNISAGYYNLATNIVHGWMADYSESNRATLGHRRWILLPTMQATGFGLVPNSSSIYRYYSTMYAHDNYSAFTNVSGVVWPAQTMPVEYFKYNYPWSYSLGSYVYPNVCIVLTRLNDNEQWVIKNSSTDGASGDGYISINNQGYGQSGCISFVPDDIRYSAGDVYQVEIIGVNFEANYTVTFISLGDDYTVQSTVSYNGTTVQPTTPEVTEPEAEEEMADISGASSWAQGELQEALDADYPVVLYPDQFQDNMTRGEFAHMLGSFIDVHWTFADSYSTAFTDLGDDADDVERNYYINALASLGIIDGYPDGTFDPDGTLTREAAAKLLTAAANTSGSVVNITQDISSYADVSSVSDWALDGVRYLNQVGVMNGTDDNCLNPDGNLTVQEAALMCYRLKP